jgi:hypothetical protein
MPLQVKVEKLIPDELLDDVKGQGLSRALAEFAQEEIAAAAAINRQALGYDPPVDIYVDGNLGVALERVQPTGIILADFKIAGAMLQWIFENLVRNSPVGPDAGGHYYQQHLLYADGQQVNPEGQIPAATEYVFVNAMPYARKLETGSSSKAPNGVYQTVATLARREFRNEASITFSYRAVIQKQVVGGRSGKRADNRNPAIIIRPK